MLPEKDVKCHRTFGLASGPLDCRTLVCEHGCRLWKRVTLISRHPETGAEIPTDSYDCLDSQQEVFWKDLLRRQEQTTATVDALRKEVREGNDQTLVGTLGRLNDKIDQQVGASLRLAGDPAKLLGA